MDWQAGEVPKTSGFLKLTIDKTFYTAGDMINGTVQTHSEKPVKIRSLDVYLQGMEKVIIDPPVGARKAHYSSTNEMLNVGLRLLENSILGPEDQTIHFQFHLPPNALPSYTGSYASVTWKLKTRADIPWGEDLNDEGYLRILAVHPEKPSSLAVENREAKPRLRLDITSNIFEPGETVEGKLTLEDPGALRSVRLQIIQSEDAIAQGTFTTAHKDLSRNVTPTLWTRRDDLPLNSAVPFRLTVPELATSDYRGAYSSVAYFVEAIMDIPYSEDIHLYAPILVGLIGKPSPETITAPVATAAAEQNQAQIPATLPGHPSLNRIEAGGDNETTQVEMATARPPDVSTGDKEPTEPQAIIIQILRDGSSKDLIEISTELQMKNQGFYDLNHVKKLCEELVSQGKLRRTAEGEFFAKYALIPNPTTQ